MNGGYNSQSSNAMVVMNAKEQGYALACNDILNMKAEDLEDE
jgi:hypothetical protein